MAWHERLAVFDLETTGVDVESARIVTAHLGVLDERGQQVEAWDWLADPGVEIPEGAAAVHGITTEMARASGRRAREVVGEVVLAVEALVSSGLPLVIYNAPYDLTLLNREARRHGIRPLADPRPVIDPLVIDKAMDRYRPGKRTLSVTSELYGVVLEYAHTAGADAVAAGRVAQALALRYADWLGDDVHEIHDRQIRWCKAQSLGFQDYVRRTRDPEFTVAWEWPERPAPVARVGVPEDGEGRPRERSAAAAAAEPAAA